MKNMSDALKAHYATGCTTLATLWKITRKDTQAYFFTDHDQPITYLGDIYVPTSGYDMSAVQTKSTMEVDDVSLTGLIHLDAITAQDIEYGLCDGAKVQISECNFTDLSMGLNVLRFGELGEIKREGQKFTAELRGLMLRQQNTIGRVVTASCDADLGDSRCKVNLESYRVAGTVLTASTKRAFTTALTQADGWFNFGKLTWVTGANANLSMDVKSFAGGAFVLQLPMPFAIGAGDTFTVTPGCNKIGRGGLDGNSTTPLDLTTGTKVLEVQAGLTYIPGVRVTLSSGTSSISGTVVSYAGSTLTINVDTVVGTGTLSSWAVSGGGAQSGDCTVKFNNYLNFRGFEDVPGQTKILQIGGQ